jgi:NADH:ubiquinone oxidoreductase subunit C
VGNNKAKLLTIWWVDAYILNVNSNKFLYNKFNNYYHITATPFFFYILLLLNKKHVNSLSFSNLDIAVATDLKSVYHSLQTFFFDYKILVYLKYTTNLYSSSTIYSGNLWLERETKEMNNINFIQLPDTRKLLSNYTYNNELIYTNYNGILNEVLV